MADSDLATLSQNGFNVVHLYLWDRQVFSDLHVNEPAGFVSPPGDPSQSPNGQWANLNDFVTRAENHGLFVALHFASFWVLDQLKTNPPPNPNTVASQYATWVGRFIQYLNSTNRHQNVLLWGMAYALQPATGQLTNNYSVVWSQSYYQVDQTARQYSPQPGVLGLIGADLSWGMAAAPPRNGSNPPGLGLPLPVAGGAAECVHDEAVAHGALWNHERPGRLSDSGVPRQFL